MNKTKIVVKDHLPKQDKALRQALKIENDALQNHLQRLEEKLDKLIKSEESPDKNNEQESVHFPKVKQTFNDSAGPIVAQNNKYTPVQGVLVSGTLRVKLIKWTVLVVDIPKLGINLERAD